MQNAIRTKFVLNILSFLLLCNFSFAQTTEIYCKQVDDIACMEMRSQEKKQMARFYKKSASELIDVVYHRCEWNIDPAVRAVSGTVTTFYLPKNALAQLVFDFADTMIVDKVMRKGVELSFTRGENTVIISLGTTLPANTLDSVSIQYHGVPAVTGFGSFTQTKHQDVPVLWTLSEPYGARDWWPCKNTLDDKIDSIDIFITCPKAYKGISNGLRQSETLFGDGSQLTTHWKHRYPIASYLVAIAVTNYEEFNDSVRLGMTNLPMQTFCYPESLTAFKAGTQNTLDAMLIFHYAFGDYPFMKEKYGHTQFSWGGGMEHQTNSFMANVGESLCAHELAHQWFGNKITCGSWEDIWLNEGFATHLASIYMEGKYPQTALETRKAEIWTITSDSTGSVKVDDTLNVSRIFSSRLSYLKGSHLLYMLRFMMGDNQFLTAVRNYQKDPAVVYGFAKTPDLQRHLEAASGLKLDSFFRQWYAGQGFPTYNVQWAALSEGVVKIKMNQQTSHSSVPFFQLPVALRFKNAVKDTTIVVNNKYNGETFIRQIGFDADSVFIDPKSWLITRNNITEKVSDLDSTKPNLIVSPNPFQDEFTILMKNFKGASFEIALYNMLGQKVFSSQQKLYNGKEYVSIPATFLSTGKYILSVLDETGEASTISLLKR